MEESKIIIKSVCKRNTLMKFERELLEEKHFARKIAISR